MARRGTFTVLLIVLFFISLSLKADYTRYISSREGISNNSVLSLCQDPLGYIWIGTCEGLNNWNGSHMFLYPDPGSGLEPLSGNLIEEIAGAEGGYMWVRSNYGLALMRDGEVVEKYDEFTGMHYMASDGTAFNLLINQADSIFVLDPSERSFKAVGPRKGLEYDKILSLVIRNEKLFAYTSEGAGIWDFAKDGSLPIPRSEPLSEINGLGKLIFAHCTSEKDFAVDNQGVLYSIPHDSETPEYLFDLSQLIRERGEISDIVEDGGDIYISFLFNGVVCLEADPSSKERFIPVAMDISCGVFCMMKDRYQDILWVGTDGQGLAMLAKDNVGFISYPFSDMPFSLSMPVRAITIDREGTLWVGTKGEGVALFQDFRSSGKIRGDKARLFTSENSALTNSTVFAFCESSKNVMWIGTEGDGLCYYSYLDGEIHSTQGNVPPDLRYIHALCESSPDTLWAATVGKGVFQLVIGGVEGVPYVKECKKLNLGRSHGDNEFYFSMLVDENDTLYLGNRGMGLVSYDRESHTATRATFDQGRNVLANDIWCITRTSEGELWVGTSYGPICVEGGRDYSTESPLGKIIHGIIEGPNGELWMSTNSGLVRYNPSEGILMSYGYSYGLQTIEFSDGATCYDPAGNIMYFGGINGLVSVTSSGVESQSYHPLPLFRHAVIQSKEGDKVRAVRQGTTLRVGQRELLSSVEVCAPDYINGENIRYVYSLGKHGNWKETSGTIRLTDLNRGNHILNVRYFNSASSWESPSVSLHLHLKHPWYFSITMRLIYCVSLAFLFLTILYSWQERRQKRREESARQQEEQRRQELFNTRVDIFENLAQELALPITLISAPCQMILDYGKSDSYIRRNSAKILQQSDKLRTLLRSFHEFRSSSFNVQGLHVKLFSVEDIVESIRSAFTEKAARRNVRLNINTQAGTTWASDPNLVTASVDILLSIAIGHAKSGDGVWLSILQGEKVSEKQLKVSVSTDFPLVQEEYAGTLLSKVSSREPGNREEASSSLGMQEEMLLAICVNYVNMLGGEFTIAGQSESTSFVLHLPSLQLEKPGEGSSRGEDLTLGLLQIDNAPAAVEDKSYSSHENRPLMYVAGTHSDVLDVVAELFKNDYNLRILSIEGSRATLMENVPDVLIVEDLGLDSGAISLCGKLRESKLFMRTPIIFLTSMKQADSCGKDIEGCSDVCVTLPFTVEQLKEQVRQQLDRLRSLKDYYNSPISVYTLSGGKILHNEDKEFLDKLTDIIKERIMDPELNVRALSREMGISVSSLYRRLENTIDSRPSDIIRECRLLYAANLLRTSKLSVDEIIYKSGFINRGTFFKNFSARFGLTPRTFRLENTKN